MTEPTMDTLKAAIIAAGDKVSAASWEDEHNIYAFGQKSCGPATYGHPLNTAHYCKDTGWLSLPNQKAVKVTADRAEAA